MRYLSTLVIAAFLLVFGLTGTIAQEDDKGFLTRTLQDVLSDAGRTVSIDGFSGALSSTASFDRLIISDDEGVWLTLIGAELDWNRSALLRGRLEVESLTAQRLDIARLPASDDSLPDAEASPFRLPELPVAIDINDFGVDEINLAAPVLGEAAQLSVAATATYSDDVADVDFEARRTDGQTGTFAIRANYERADGLLDLLVDLQEGASGIVSGVLNIPDRPSVQMSVSGSGPLDDFATDVRLATDGQERLAGQVTLNAETPGRGSDAPDRRIVADIGGDITAVLAPRYRDFFGTDVALTLDALLAGTGGLEVNDFTLEAQAASLAGQVTLNADNWPTFVAIRGTVANPDGTNVLLPLGGAATTVEKVDLQIDYDASNGDAVTAMFDVSALALDAATIAQTTLAFDGTLQGEAGTVGQFGGDLTFDATGVTLTDGSLGEAVGDQIKGSAAIAYTEDEPLEISDLIFGGADYSLTGNAVIDGIESGLATTLDARLSADDLSRFSALAGRELDGQTALVLSGDVELLSGQMDLRAQGTATDVKTGITQADAVLAGQTELDMTVSRDETGTFLRDVTLQNAALDLTGLAQLRSDDSQAEAQFTLQDIGLVLPQYSGPVTVEATADQDADGWRIDAATQGPYGAALTAKGLATGPDAALDFTANVPDVSAFAEGVPGAVQATGTLRQTPQGWQVTTDATGPYATTASVEGLITPAIDVTFDLAVPDVQPVVPQVSGPLRAQGQLRQTDAGFTIDTTATGPYGARAAVEGLATGPDMSLTFQADLPNVAPLAPGINGPLSASGVVRQTTDGIALNANGAGPYSSQVSVQGIVTGAQAAVDFRASLPNIGSLVDKVNGPLTVTGSARKAGTAWQIDTQAQGPAGTQAQVAGRVNEDGTLNLDIDGSAPLGLARPFIAPRDLQGQARFDLSVNGPAALSSLSGQIQTSGATLTAPTLPASLQDISANVVLGRNRARLDVSANGVNGGQVGLAGDITLTSALPADLQVTLQNLILLDPQLYETTINGALRIAGPLTGGAQISGQVDVGETNVNVPSTGLTSIGDIPAITHIGAKPQVIATRRKAGLNGAGAGNDPSDSGSGPGFGLNLRINAPGRIFVRGRGLDAELGGSLTLTGTTNRLISAGRFELIRGRLSILGKRFDLDEGTIQFQGDLVPYISFQTTTSTTTGTVSVVVEGPADDPDVSFESSPEAPQDEVLAQLLFGRNLSDISAFQALQLANAVATLAGRGGVDVISNLRNGFGLDDLEVTTDDNGATAVRAGKYLTENVYSDVTAASDGTGEVSLNLDITPNLTGKATLGSDGDSGIGIFFEKDY